MRSGGSVSLPVVPELVAPAGDWECARAAVENGADAIYFGLERHNARMRAANFNVAALPQLMQYLHLRNVRGYVTFNTLIFPDEMDEAERWLRSLIEAGTDAAIVQDVGVCRLIRRISPDFPVHASTQMTITSAAGVEFARNLGCRLVILARECSVRDIERIREAFEESKDPGSGLPLEIFVHGALCVAYSGQCLTSESLGGRSANRGVCAQACRLPYDLLADGQPVPLGDRRYLLSPRDLAGLEMLPDLVRAGVSSLKIEGRLKSPEYVANITGIYRKALDRIALEHFSGVAEGNLVMHGCVGTAGAAVRELVEESRYDMEMAFSRGLYTGWLGGTNNQELVHGRFGKKRGVYLGEVTRVSGGTVSLKLEAALKPGDGVVFDSGRPEEQEEGGRVYALRHDQLETRLEFGHGAVDFRRVHPGDKAWKTSDPELDRRLRRTFADGRPRFRRPVAMEISGKPGKPLVLKVRDERGAAVCAESRMPLEKAERHPLGLERLKEQLGRLGDTQFRLNQLISGLEGDCHLPLSELNRMRREAVDRLCALRALPPKWTLIEPGDNSPDFQLTEAGMNPPEDPDLCVLVRNLAQLQAALQADVRTVYCEFEDPKKYRDAVSLFRRGANGGTSGREDRDSPQPAATIWVAPPRIFKPGEEWILRLVRSCDADGYLVRNFDHLRYFSDCRAIGDYSLNVANALSAEYFIRHCGLERVTASYDLNIAQLEALLRSAPSFWFEVTIHQHMPMFHMEHCLFCAFLTKGTDYTNCGRPCDTREVRLRDRAGASHGVLADAGCRNTIFNALAQTGAESVARLAESGVRSFRIEFLDESPELLTRTIACYRKLLKAEMTGSRLWQELKLLNQIGVTRGSMD